MCLDIEFNKIKTEKILKKLPKTFKVYKIFKKDGKKYLSLFDWSYHYKEGENRARLGGPILGIDPNAGFYSFKSWFGAFSYNICNNDSYVVKCQINKKDILKVGTEEGSLIFVTSKITISKYK